MQPYVMEPKKSSAAFRSFLGGLSCAVLFTRTVVSGAGDWEGSGGFPIASGPCSSPCYGCRLFSQPAPSGAFGTPCVRGRQGIVVGRI